MIIKKIVLSFLLLTLGGYSYSQTFVQGYYITLNNDSIPAQIKMPKSVFGGVDLSKLFFKVEIEDSNSSTQKFNPKDINRFGFIYNEEDYVFYSKPMFVETSLRFVQPSVLGEKSSLYEYQTFDQNGAPIGTFYTIEKNEGTFIFISTALKSLDKFKETLKEGYQENPNLQLFIDSKFKDRKSIKSDIIEIVQAANNQ